MTLRLRQVSEETRVAKTEADDERITRTFSVKAEVRFSREESVEIRRQGARVLLIARANDNRDRTSYASLTIVELDAASAEQAAELLLKSAAQARGVAGG